MDLKTLKKSVGIKEEPMLYSEVSAQGGSRCLCPSVSQAPFSPRCSSSLQTERAHPAGIYTHSPSQSNQITCWVFPQRLDHNLRMSFALVHSTHARTSNPISSEAFIEEHKRWRSRTRGHCRSRRTWQLRKWGQHSGHLDA